MNKKEKIWFYWFNNDVGTVQLECKTHDKFISLYVVCVNEK